MKLNAAMDEAEEELQEATAPAGEKEGGAAAAGEEEGRPKETAAVADSSSVGAALPAGCWDEVCMPLLERVVPVILMMCIVYKLWVLSNDEDV